MRRRPILTAVTILIVAAMVYALIEAAARLANHYLPYGIGGVKDGYQRLEKQLREAEDSRENIENLSLRLGFDRELGWGREVRIDYKAPQKIQNNEISIAFFGDSITAGEGVGFDGLYTTLLTKDLGASGARITNFAAVGYGVDQMLLKARAEISNQRYDIVVFAYIPHDLLRIGANFLFDRPKPKLREQQGNVFFGPPEPLREFYNDYLDANKYFALSIWSVRFVYGNRQYFAPTLFGDYYSAAFDYMIDEMVRLGVENEMTIVIAKLSNTTKFRGREEIEVLFERAAARRIKPGSLDFYDLDECTRKLADSAEMNWEQVFVYHPAEFGHSMYANCFTEYLRDRLNQN